MRLQLPYVLGIGIPAFFAFVVTVVLIATSTTDSGTASDPISQDQLVSSYSALVTDSADTPADITHLADTACERLDAGVPARQLVADTAPIYGSRQRAQQVLRVLVAYGCPRYSV